MIVVRWAFFNCLVGLKARRVADLTEFASQLMSPSLESVECPFKLVVMAPRPQQHTQSYGTSFTDGILGLRTERDV